MSRSIPACFVKAFTWLPQLLLAEFKRHAASEVTGTAVELEIEWSEPAEWPKPGRRRFGTILRDVEWYYRNGIRRPHDKSRDGLYALGVEWAEQQERDGVTIANDSQHSTPENAIKRVAEHVACINAPMPDLTSWPLS